LQNMQSHKRNSLRYWIRGDIVGWQIVNALEGQMNVGRSINIAMAKNDMNRTALAKAMNTTNQNVHHMITRGTASAETLTKLAGVFKMSVSEFIKLGED